MPKADDPFYNRKPVPDEFIKDVGITGLTQQEEWANRERKMSIDGVDIRKFSNSRKSGMEPQDDPYYGRKPVNKAELEGVGETGLTAEEEYDNRERKMSVNGVDIRKFGNKANSGFKPQNDPYYGRKQVDSALTKGIGETYNTPAQDYATRERKQSILEFSSDPFQLITGTGHRQSISTEGALSAANAATERRRSSAIAPDAAAAAAAHHHSGYDGDNRLAPIASRQDGGESSGSGSALNNGAGGGTAGVASNNFGISSDGGAEHAKVHDATTAGHSHGDHGLVSRPLDLAPEEGERARLEG